MVLTVRRLNVELKNGTPIPIPTPNVGRVCVVVFHSLACLDSMILRTFDDKSVLQVFVALHRAQLSLELKASLRLSSIWIL
jgi:hypothetical protein